MAGFEKEVAYNRQMAAHRREVRKTGGGSPPVPPAPLPGDAVNTQPQTWPPTGHVYNPRSVIIIFLNGEQKGKLLLSGGSTGTCTCTRMGTESLLAQF